MNSVQGAMSDLLSGHQKSQTDYLNDMASKLSGWLGDYPGASPRLYLVGGGVRDLMRLCHPKDMDLVCRDAAEVARTLASINDAVLVPMEKKVDQPCYRVVDRRCSNNFLDIAEMQGSTIDEDLVRRDFTINAMAIELGEGGKPGRTIDPLHAVRDLENRIIRSASPDSFLSDPLRILRAVRFAASLNFEIEPSTRIDMARLAHLLPQASSERIASELLLILNAPRSTRFVGMMDRLGILAHIFPEILPMKGCIQNAWHHLDVWQHSLSTMENCEIIIDHLSSGFHPADRFIQNDLSCQHRRPLLMLAALLHDAGKPSARDIHPENGRITFYGHDQTGSKITDDIGRRLKLSNRDRAFLSLLVAEHLHVRNLSAPEVKPLTRMRWFRRLKDDALPVLVLSMADAKSKRGADSSGQARNTYIEWCWNIIAEYCADIRTEVKKPWLVSGNDILAMGMKSGPELGHVLTRIHDAQDAGSIRSREEALALARRLMAS